jgi:hypothetical protein
VLYGALSGLAAYSVALAVLIVETIRAVRLAKRTPSGVSPLLWLKWGCAGATVAAVALVVAYATFYSSDAALGVVAFAFLVMLPVALVALATSLAVATARAWTDTTGEPGPGTKDPKVRLTNASS